MDIIYLMEKAFSLSVFGFALYSLTRTCKFKNADEPQGRYLEFLSATNTGNSVKIPVYDCFRITTRDLKDILKVNNIKKTNLIFEINENEPQVKIHIKEGYIATYNSLCITGSIDLQPAQEFSISGVIKARYIVIDY